MFVNAAKVQGSAMFALRVFVSSIASDAVIETKKFWLFLFKVPLGVS